MGVGIKKFRESRSNQGAHPNAQQGQFLPVARESLCKEERAKALASLVFLKEKRDDSVEAWMCIDGRKQRGDWAKQDTTSPTVSTEAVFITALIEVHNERNVACFNIPGAFLHAIWTRTST
jgi:hypothetical protein